MAKILIIEDEQVLNQAYKMILEQEKHEVITAFNGQDGLDALKSFKPDIILLDILMPVMDGLHFLEAFRTKDKKTTVVVMTNLDKDKQVEKALELGAYKYIVKAHSSPKELAAQVNHLIKKNLSSK